MTGLFRQLDVGIRLHYRNKMALIYAYLFPTIFLIAFWVLYRYEKPLLVRHVGEVLTVTILGGACFGLPTTIVSERERGVWRRYRLTPASTATLVVSALVTRYLLLLVAGLLQLVLAVAIGMPSPAHPLALFVAFTFVSFAFMGLGLVIAMMADNVPAVQALGQCIFLPMLILGGIAVPLASLPDWAQRLSAFFPGRHAVEAFRGVALGEGLSEIPFSLVALTIIGAAGCLAAGLLFRWDAQQRFATMRGKGWVAVALAAWLAVGLMSEWRVRAAAAARQSAAGTARPTASTVSNAAAPAVPTVTLSPAELASAGSTAPPALLPPRVATAPPRTTAPAAPAGSASTPQPRGETAAPPAPVTPPQPADSGIPEGPSTWQAVTLDDIDRAIDFTRLPSDGGIVTPIAGGEEQVDPDTNDQLTVLWNRLAEWTPIKVDDPVQRARNYLYAAAVPDVLQVPLERFAASVVYERLEGSIPKDQLIKVLYWVALHPADGDDSAVGQLYYLGIDQTTPDLMEVRNRAAIYGVKLLGRLTGRIVPK